MPYQRKFGPTREYALDILNVGGSISSASGMEKKAGPEHSLAGDSRTKMRPDGDPPEYDELIGSTRYSDREILKAERDGVEKSLSDSFGTPYSLFRAPKDYADVK
jgi:hypothetical protein